MRCGLFPEDMVGPGARASATVSTAMDRLLHKHCFYCSCAEDGWSDESMTRAWVLPVHVCSQGTMRFGELAHPDLELSPGSPWHLPGAWEGGDSSKSLLCNLSGAREDWGDEGGAQSQWPLATMRGPMGQQRTASEKVPRGSQSLEEGPHHTRKCPVVRGQTVWTLLLLR